MTDTAKEISNKVVSTLGKEVNKESVIMIIALYEASKSKEKGYSGLEERFDEVY